MIYSIAYRLFIYPSLFLLFQLLAAFSPKVKRALELRQPTDAKLPWLNFPASTRPIWFHCASGEFEYAKPVINALKLRNPEIKILLTYFSPSVLDSIVSFKNLDFYCPLPWDQPKILREFLAHHAPRALLIARTDAWPEMLTQTQKLKIPSLLFSATLAKQSSRMSWFAKPFTAWTLGMLKEIHCVSPEDFENFKALGLEKITKICGDTRYDQVIDRLKNPKPLKDALFRHKPNEKIVVAGSTWPEDEEILLDLIHKSMKKTSNFRFVLVPHEPTSTHLAQLKQAAESLGIHTEFYSQIDVWKPNSILLVDQVGILAELYAYGVIAFIGGSFRKSVHSVMEPLAAGCISVVGPKHSNNREAIFMKKIALKSFAKFSPVTEIKGAKDFLRLLDLIERQDLSELSREIQSLITARAGEATEKTLLWLAPHLK